MEISQRLYYVPASPMRKLAPFAAEAKKQGVHVYHLNIGDPDIKTPQVMLDVLSGWDKNPIGYDQSQGNPAFIEALVSYYHKLGFAFVGTQNIQVTTGGSEAISMAMFAVCQPGDEIIVFEPFYANYNSYAVINGVKLIPVKTAIETGFHLPDRKTIEAKISAKTKAILICNPNNPTGTVYTKAEMEMLVLLAKSANLYLLSDEVYREFTYDKREHVSILSYMKSYPDRMILLDSLSKRYSLCGARLGALITLNDEISAGVLRMAQGRLSSGLIDQTLAAKLTDVPETYFKAVHDEYEKRRNILFSGLRAIPGVTVPKPEGAFYTIVGLPVADSENFCKWLLTDFRDQNETIMIAPAAGFYATPGLGKNEVRIAYVLNTDSLKRSIGILDKALTLYRSRKEK
jgi:aspartate aminotransferase